MAPSSTSDRLNPTDATLWQIQRDPLLRTTIVGLALLDQQPAWDALVATIRRAIDRLPRLRQHVVDGPLGLGRPHWADAELDLDHHLFRTTIDDATDLRALLDIVGGLASDELDLARPLWQLHLIEDAGTGAALVFKLSHTLTDGVGGMSLLRIFDDEAPTPRPLPAEPEHHAGESALHAVAASASLISAAAHSALHPLDTTTSALGLAGSAVRLMAPAGPPLSPLMTERSETRWAGTTEIPLDRLRAAAHRADGTLNDAFVTIAIGALQDHHQFHDRSADGFRVTMPVDIRRRSDVEGGNQWAPARLVLHPSAASHPFVALHEHRSTITRAIHEPAIPFIQPLAAAVQQLPDDWTINIVANMVKGSDLVLTNVPGLREPLRIAGAEVTRFYPFAPTGGAAVNIGLVSHLDTACVGFNVDTEALADPETLLGFFDQRADDFLRRRRAPAADKPKEATPEAAAPWTVDRKPVEHRGDHDAGHQRLSALDTSFLRMESPATPMHMGGLFVIDGSNLLDSAGHLDLDTLRVVLDERLQATPRLRRRLRELPLGLGRPVWVDDPRFDIAKHVHRQTLASPGGRAQLIEACEHLQMVRLDRNRPLFELTFFDGLDPDVFGPGSIALIDRVHHALLDGVSGLEMVQAIFDPDSMAADPTPQAATQPTPPPSPLRLATDTIVEQAKAPLELTRQSVRWLSHPKEAGETLATVAASASNMLGQGAGATSLNAPVGRHRRLRTVEVPLADVRAIGADLGGSVNDVLLAAVACGISKVLRSRGTKPIGSLHALVPVSTRHRGLEAEEGNQVAALVVELPLGNDPAATLRSVTERTKQLKKRGIAGGSKTLLDAADLLPPTAIDQVSRLARHQRWVNMTVTNIRGPADPISLLGGQVRELVPIVPLGANLTIGLAIVSYHGALTLAFHADRDRWPDLDVVTTGVGEALDALSRDAEGSDERGQRSQGVET